MQIKDLQYLQNINKEITIVNEVYVVESYHSSECNELKFIVDSLVDVDIPILLLQLDWRSVVSN